MVKPVRIAVISDLHVGSKARALDLCPHELPHEKKLSKSKDFLKVFVEHVGSEKFRQAGGVDQLFVTGDISNYADPTEFNLASEVVQKIADAMGVATENIFFVPGNHDLHWPVMKLVPTSFWQNFRYAPLMQPDLIFRKRIDDAKIGAFDKAPYFIVWDSLHSLVIALNTAAFDSPDPETGKHNGLVSQETLNELDSFLATIPFDSSHSRICLLHHHPIQYSDLVPNIPDYSALTNAENLRELLSKHRVDIAIHGHKHVPHLQHTHAVTNGHPLTILGAGSFSAELETQWTGTTQNQFHIINVEGRNPNTHAVYGYVETWNFEVSGSWRASNSHTGLNATEGFGSLTTIAEIKAQVEPLVNQLISAQGTCTWEDVNSKHPHLAHVKTQVAFEVFSEIGRAKGLRVYGDVNTVDRMWALLPAAGVVK